MKLSKNSNPIFEILQDAADECDFQIRESYSGRGMFGKDCFGIVGSFENLGTFISMVTAELIESFYEEGDTLFDNMRMDNMGQYDYIFYWPDIQIED